VIKVLVLGCGPAGLLAAERLEREGADVRIAAKKVKSIMPGAQYLHMSIGGVTPQEPLDYLCLRKLGTKEGYASKVYGDPEHPVSWEKYEEGYVPAWSLEDAYSTLWLKWEERIVDRELSAKIVSVLAAAYDLVISTIPAPFLCLKVCQFNSATVFISRYPRPWVPKNTIVYNGLSKNDWYRTSLIFGHGSTEYAEPPHMIPTIEARKPTGTNCECQPKNVIRLGRFGAWEKGFLVHHAWEKAADALHEVQ
jgi:hypothetical protein